jgi:imidazole glycerol-phosphate synthase subunit HisH
MRTVGIICGSASRAAPTELVFRHTCAETRRSFRVHRVADPSEIGACDHVVLAPTGTFASVCSELAGGMAVALTEHVNAGKPCLGMSLGMLVMFRSSATHTGAKGLGWFEGECRALPSTTQPLTGARAKSPHVGWNRLMIEPACHPVIAAAGRSGTWMYFCHDEYAVPADPAVIAATTEFGAERLAAGVQRGSVVATLFKPERSHRAGIRLIVAFLDQG